MNTKLYLSQVLRNNAKVHVIAGDRLTLILPNGVTVHFNCVADDNLEITTNAEQVTETKITTEHKPIEEVLKEQEKRDAWRNQ